MASLLRKVASAFVVMEDDVPPAGPAAHPKSATPNAGAAPPSPGASRPAGTRQGSPRGGLDDLTSDAAALLAQLEGRATAPSAKAHDASPVGAQASAQAAKGAGSTIFDKTAEDVFSAAKLGQNANSASRLLKIVAGLQMFPREHQLTMIQAMDAADDSWSQADVLRDAESRRELLHGHLQQLAHEREQRLGSLTQAMDTRKRQGSAVLIDIDRKIAELQTLREKEITATTTELAFLEQEQRTIESREAQARQGIEQVVGALAGLATLLGTPGVPPLKT